MLKNLILGVVWIISHAGVEGKTQEYCTIFSQLDYVHVWITVCFIFNYRLCIFFISFKYLSDIIPHG